MDDSQPESRVADEPAGDPVHIGRGEYASAYLFPSLSLVLKQFHTSDPAEAAYLANWEFDYLKRLSPIYAQRPFVHCPEPMSVDPEAGAVRMSFVSGIRLDHLLADTADTSISEHLDHVADQISVAIEDYITEFAEPLYSIGMHNMLYDQATRILSLIDLTSVSRGRVRQFDPGRYPFEITLGIFAGRSMFLSAGPGDLLNHRHRARIQRLLIATSLRLQQRHNIDLALVREVSRHTHTALARKGHTRKRIWMLTMGHVLSIWRMNQIVSACSRQYREASLSRVDVETNRSLAGSQNPYTVLLEPGAQARIELNTTSMVVRKTFTAGDPVLAAAQARTEFQHLRLFSHALEGQPFIRCPEPVSMNPEAGEVQMTYCPGERLNRALENPASGIQSHLNHIAQQTALAIEIYIKVCNEPYFDFTTHNMLYDARTRILSLVDFTHPGIYLDYDPQEVKYDLSIGNFIASTTYHTVKRRTWSNLGYWRRQKHLTTGLIQTLRVRHDLKPAVIRRVQAEKYQSLTFHGSFMRALWFSTIGKALYSRRVNSVIAELGG